MCQAKDRAPKPTLRASSERLNARSTTCVPSFCQVMTSCNNVAAGSVMLQLVATLLQALNDLRSLFLSSDDFLQ